MSYETILVNVEKNIATLTFNRPKALNALNDKLLTELSTALDEIAAQKNIHVLVLTGAGHKAFVAGADITELATLDVPQGKRCSQKGHAAIGKLQELTIPVIAAVNGFALGGGSEMALASDFIYASETAKFGLPEITLGIIPGFGGTQRLARAVGANIAKEMILTGKMISAAEAKEIGMVNKVVAPEALMDEVMKTAEAIAAKGRVPVSAAKHAINAGLNGDLPSGCAIEVEAFATCVASGDAKEGTSAFLEKRKPIFNAGSQK
ncbi:enoyl-CoA hydratase-related protein [Desulfoluna sp.]|uniref:enoyl-CoA hydratase/isomerase family protein n=1 Tax=Desulfoluna sp. TaxID=2045199 RepID=UPI00260E19CF|nr:enoyl-CoA hydratase-related protein [Desulfoluna sp.]